MKILENYRKTWKIYKFAKFFRTLSKTKKTFYYKITMKNYIFSTLFPPN